VNRHVRILAYLYIAFCGAALAVGLFLCIGLLFSRDENSAKALLTIGMPFLILSAIYFIPGLVGGIGLLKGKPWARTVIIVLSVLVLLLIPVGTVFGGYALWVLRRGGPTLPNDAAPADRPSGIPPRLAPPSPEQKSRYAGILLAMAGVGSAFIVAIGTGFRLTREPVPPVIDALYFAAIIVLVLVIMLAARAWARNPRPRLPVARWFGADRRRLAESRRRSAEDRRRRLAELAAHPVRRKYVERVERGEYWSDEQIDYNEDPNRLATCVHLQPIEREMRRMGIQMRPVMGSKVDARCCVDPVALEQQFVLAPSVHYAEPPAYDRSLEDPPAALITCDVDRSVIDVVHRLRARLDTPWFPAGSGEEIQRKINGVRLL
jgi:hypothetical protein